MSNLLNEYVRMGGRTKRGEVKKVQTEEAMEIHDLKGHGT